MAGSGGWSGFFPDFFASGPTCFKSETRKLRVVMKLTFFYRNCIN